MKHFLLTFAVALLFLAPLVSNPTNADDTKLKRKVTWVIGKSDCDFGVWYRANGFGPTQEEAIGDACTKACQACELEMDGVCFTCEVTSQGCCHGGLYFAFARVCCE